jgi:hypothetical protein
MKGATTTRLAHSIFHPVDDYELRKSDSRIRYRLRRLAKAGLVRAMGSVWCPVEERAYFTRGRVVLDYGPQQLEGIFLVVTPLGSQPLVMKVPDDMKFIKNF